MMSFAFRDMGLSTVGGTPNHSKMTNGIANKQWGYIIDLHALWNCSSKIIQILVSYWDVTKQQDWEKPTANNWLDFVLG